jgi:hypothetical protein
MIRCWIRFKFKGRVMRLSKKALTALQQMMGEEGSVFNRNLFLRHWTSSSGREDCSIFPDKVVELEVFEKLKRSKCIIVHCEGNPETWILSNVGRKALKDAGMETRKGKLTRDDIQWLCGTGYYAQ